MVTTYRLNVNDLSLEVLDSIKVAFKDKVVEITVTEAVDETEYLLSSKSNADVLNRAQDALTEGKGVTFSVNDFETRYGNK